MNKQQLAAKIWESANKMRSKIEANEYKDYILGFIFYKYLSDRELAFLRSEGASAADIEALSEDDTATVGFIQGNIGYFIAYENLFSSWLAAGSDFNIAHVRDALSAYERLISPNHKRVFAGIFNTLQTGLSKLGDSAASQTKAVRDLLYLIKDIPTDSKQDYDVLGFIYEYLISNFAANAGKKAGEFYTPHEVSVLMSEIVADHLHDRDKIQIYDPTSGSGSLLLNIGQAVARHIGSADGVKYYAQELKQNTYNLTRMNLVMRGITPANIVTRNADTLEDDWPYFDDADPIGSYDPLYVDAVVSNPPYSQAWDPAGKDNDPRYKEFGLAPKSKADYAFLLHDLFHLNREGIMTIVLPHGVLFRGGEEGKIRQKLIERNHIDAVIGLPANIFFGTGIPTIIMVLKQKRDNNDVLIVDASQGFEKVGKNNVLRASDIKRIVDTVSARASVPKFSRLVPREEISANDYNLNIPRYVDSATVGESFDLYASMFGGIPETELSAFADFWEALPGLKDALFEPSAQGYYQVRAGINIHDAVAQHSSVQDFSARFADRFSDFSAYLRRELIDSAASLALASMEDVLARELFRRLDGVPLVDKYRAYQLLHDEWVRIGQDIEIIQTEGWSALTQVDPRLVLKKIKGKDAEVQEGWQGRILPFNLVQEQLLASELERVKELENESAACVSGLDEILDSLSEEDKQEARDAFNEEMTAFAAAGLAAFVKAALKERSASEWGEESVQGTLIRAQELLTRKKQLDKQIKTDKEQLHITTKQTIEALDENQARQLLAHTWITPIISGIENMPSGLLKDFTQALSKLATKYEVTFADLDADISRTEHELAVMLDDLVGSETDMQAINELKTLLDANSVSGFGDADSTGSTGDPR